MLYYETANSDFLVDLCLYRMNVPVELRMIVSRHGLHQEIFSNLCSRIEYLISKRSQADKLRLISVFIRSIADKRLCITLNNPVWTGTRRYRLLNIVGYMVLSNDEKWFNDYYGKSAFEQGYLSSVISADVLKKYLLKNVGIEDERIVDCPWESDMAYFVKYGADVNFVKMIQDSSKKALEEDEEFADVL
jgi:hypothetical protein